VCIDHNLEERVPDNDHARTPDRQCPNGFFFSILPPDVNTPNMPKSLHPSPPNGFVFSTLPPDPNGNLAQICTNPRADSMASFFQPPAPDRNPLAVHKSAQRAPLRSTRSNSLKCSFMRIALGQINPTVGDLAGNVARMSRFARDAAQRGADLIVFPELSVTGYPPRDLVEKPSFLKRSEQAVQQLAAETASLPIAILAGYVGRSHLETGKCATNSAAVIRGGQILLRQTKMLLPTYDVFDEDRYFVPAERQDLLPYASEKLAIAICEDAWNDKQFWLRPLYTRDPVEDLISAGGSILIIPNASPWNIHKRALRHDMWAAAARRHRVPVIAVNQVGGNDSLVFDGSSLAFNAEGQVIASATSFSEDLVLVDTKSGQGDLNANFGGEPGGVPCDEAECEAVYEALVLGTRDYIRKCSFSRVLIGLSGGIDSSLTAAIAVEAVGRENVIGVGMPGPFSSDHSVSDARVMAENLGIRFELISISSGYDAMVSTLAPVFAGASPDVTEENIQSRLRGLTLMALSNKWGALVLTTGNKSEIAVGYCTLYGDMCGGLAVISDVPKTMVYDLSRVANRRLNNAIPENVFIKPPSAELRPDQKDTDSLPPYDVLDAILRAYIEEFKAPGQIAEELRLPLNLVKDIALKVDRNEYKRQQAAPGLKVTTKAFGIGRRFPIAQRYSE
jgi:NAD+ synthase (glutamine-hydrolysing)